MGPGFWGGIKAKSAENQLGKICRLGTTSTQDIRSSTSLGRNRHDLRELFFVKQFDLPSENVGEKKNIRDHGKHMEKIAKNQVP